MTVPKAPKELTLFEPIRWDGQEITRLRIAKPKVKDLKQMQQQLEGVEDRLEQGIIMAAALTGMPSAFIEELDTDDFTAISEVIADFFPRGTALANGEASSPKLPTG
jgi:hypothetical protein